MKKIQKGKLSLGTETIKKLDGAMLQRVGGAWTNTCLGTNCQCYPTQGTDCDTNGENCNTNAATACVCTTVYVSNCNC